MSKSGKFMPAQPDGLVDFGGKGKYSAPTYVWSKVVAPTALKFLNSKQSGKKYQDDLFVASFNFGEIYDFDLSKNRSKLEPSDASNKTLPDKVDIKSVLFADGLGEITHIDVGSE